MARQESKAVNQVLTGSETAKDALALLEKKYGHAKTVQMLNRGEYDVLYRATRQVTTSEQRKAQKVRIDAMEKELARRGVVVEDLLKGIGKK